MSTVGNASPHRIVLTGYYIAQEFLSISIYIIALLSQTLTLELNTSNYVFPRVRNHHLYVLVYTYTYNRKGNQKYQFTFTNEEDRPYIANSSVSTLCSQSTGAS